MNRTTTQNRGVRRGLMALGKGSLLACTVALALLATAGAAQASSIVFIRAGDVWLTTPDGSRELRVTSGQRFNHVSQADDGTIFAEGNGVLRRFAPDGRELASPAGTASLFDLDVSPDGSKIAFWYPVFDGGRVSVIDSDGSPAGWDDTNGEYIQWASNDLAIHSNGAGWIDTFVGPGTPSGANWFATNPDGRKYAPAITRAGDKLAVVFRDWDPDSFGEVGPYKIAWYANSSPPPRDGVFGEEPDQRPTHRCTVVSGDAQPGHPSFSPDGAAIAWEYPDGVRVQPALDLGSCTQPGGGFAIPGAGSPDWGPADVPAARADVPVRTGDVPGKPGTTTTGGEELEFKTTVRKQRLRKVLRKGLRIKVTCTAACTVTRGQLSYRGRVVAKRRKALPSGTGSLVVRFTAKGKKLLERVKKARFAIRLTVTDAQGNAYAGRRAVTLRR